LVWILRTNVGPFLKGLAQSLSSLGFTTCSYLFWRI